MKPSLRGLVMPRELQLSACVIGGLNKQLHARTSARFWLGVNAPLPPKAKKILKN